MKKVIVLFRKITKIIFVLVLGLSSTYATSITEVTSFINEGVTLCKEKGNTYCFKEFSNKNGSFIRGDLYIFAYNFKGINKAHGANPRLLGKNLYKIKDASGLMLVQEFIKIAKNEGEGWIDYKWSHPMTKKISSKTSFIKKIEGDIFIGAGYYK